jgi:hypothetical protein
MTLEEHHATEAFDCCSLWEKERPSICCLHSTRNSLGLSVCANVRPAVRTTGLCVPSRCQPRLLGCDPTAGRPTFVEHPRTIRKGCPLLRRPGGGCRCPYQLRRQVPGDASVRHRTKRNPNARCRRRELAISDSLGEPSRLLVFRYPRWQRRDSDSVALARIKLQPVRHAVPWSKRKSNILRARWRDLSKQFAQKLVSDEGRHNGLYWHGASNEVNSPINPLIASAHGKSPNDPDGDRYPFNGYFFRILTSQGPHHSAFWGTPDAQDFRNLLGTNCQSCGSCSRRKSPCTIRREIHRRLEGFLH